MSSSLGLKKISDKVTGKIPPKRSKNVLWEQVLDDIQKQADLFRPPKELVEQVTNQYSLLRQDKGPKPYISDMREAIERRQRGWIYYIKKGDENHEIQEGYRLIEPYVLGTGLKPKPSRYQPQQMQNNNVYLRAFVIRELGSKGGIPSVSLTKDEPYWRMFRLDKISSWKTIPSFFYRPRDGYNPNDKDIVSIIASAKF